MRSATRHSLVDLGRARFTPEHPVFADGAWVTAGELRQGVRVLDPTGSRVGLERAIAADESALVFDLAVEWPHTFFAGGVLVHNKAVAVEFAPGDPWHGAFLRKTDAKL